MLFFQIVTYNLPSQSAIQKLSISTITLIKGYIKRIIESAKENTAFQYGRNFENMCKTQICHLSCHITDQLNQFGVPRGICLFY